MKKKQTEFILEYVKNSNISESDLNRLGLFAIPCDCGSKCCSGWVMVTKANLKDHINLYLGRK